MWFFLINDKYQREASILSLTNPHSQSIPYCIPLPVIPEQLNIWYYLLKFFKSNIAYTSSKGVAPFRSALLAKKRKGMREEMDLF